MEVRYTKPDQYSFADYGKLVKVMKDGGDYEIWIQSGKELVNWIRLGELLEWGFEKFLEDPAFVALCLRLYEQCK